MIFKLFILSIQLCDVAHNWTHIPILILLHFDSNNDGQEYIPQNIQRQIKFDVIKNLLTKVSSLSSTYVCRNGLVYKIEDKLMKSRLYLLIVLY